MSNRTETRIILNTLWLLASLTGFLIGPASAAPRTPRPATTRYTTYERLTLTLPKAFRNERDVTLQLGVHDGEVLQAWGKLEGVNRIIDHFDVNELTTAKNRLAAILRATRKRRRNSAESC